MTNSVRLVVRMKDLIKAEFSQGKRRKCMETVRRNLRLMVCKIKSDYRVHFLCVPFKYEYPLLNVKLSSNPCLQTLFNKRNCGRFARKSVRPNRVAPDYWFTSRLAPKSISHYPVNLQRSISPHSRLKNEK